MSVYSKRIRIIIVGVVLTICVVGGTMAFQSDAKSTINQSLTNSLNYPENERGQTFGSAEATSVEMLPDLIHGGSVNGIKGYLLKKDYLGEPGGVPLYDVDGVNIIGSLYISPKNMNYPKNKNGQTYGSAADATSPETEPDLIQAEGVDGTVGYVLKKDLDGEQPKTPEEAIAIQNSRPPGGYDYPLYDVDGKTVIGVFHIGGN
ncbi:hypothetical protein Back11_16030 [Paenibacillus baekrokdamisoli]|uniref:Uncharacterized protein n=1 Tax=Paenibacillus baekrokdamisoli TaxID=1712516 RepID=A0A3G9J8T3_9BACL|nr:hypothetical protein [Paenibacillus baekrokdamisoli]MBB3073464.1 hypothetical protein [Paenibacillus baekrokdamisoli]BBH20258.1 hypothetical protein Back11_16030 [Paenibacillus baekrokdamisoli]